MIDIRFLVKSLNSVLFEINKVANADNQQTFLDYFEKFGENTKHLLTQAAKRQMEMKDPRMRDDLAAARAVLKKNSMMLLTASKVFVRHPELSAAKENRDFIYKQVCEAVNTISDVANGRNGDEANTLIGDLYNLPGELATALDDFDERIIMNPLDYNKDKTRPDLEERLESIISGAALMADSSCTRDERR